LKHALDEGRSEREICDDDELFPAWVKYHRAIERYKRLHTMRARNWATHTTVLYGPPGTGKTRWCMDHGGEEAYWLKKPIGNSVFFDGYDGQEIVIIDEFYGWIPFDLLQRMCDRYPLLVDTKGGMTNFYPKKIFITSNKHPSQWYKNGMGALARRFSDPLGRIIFCGEDWDGIVKKCDPRPIHFETALALQAYNEAHRRCTEDRCIVVDPAPPASSVSAEILMEDDAEHSDDSRAALQLINMDDGQDSDADPFLVPCDGDGIRPIEIRSTDGVPLVLDENPLGTAASSRCRLPSRLLD
jgi:hypothetical protein